MTTHTSLPPGQYAIENFPRFGLPRFANRFPADPARVRVRIGGDVRNPVTVEGELEHLARAELCADFHCVTTWTRRAVPWGGFRFSDFYRRIVVPLAGPDDAAVFVVLYGQDGYRSSLPLHDLLAPDVLLADRLDGQALSIAHGAPLRLVAPAHYGYKSVKHVSRIEFRRNSAGYRPSGLRFMAHPRARVAHEERGRWVPGWLLRYLYRLLVHPTARRFERALQRHAARIDRQA